MTERFEGKIAIVTGGASGIGRAIATALHAEGAHVMIADLRPPADGTTDDRLMFTAADVTDKAQLEAVFERTRETVGPVELMFNVAGGGRAGSILDLSYEDWRFCVDLNMSSVFLGTSLAAQSFLASGTRGTITNIASINALVPLHGGLGYAAAKAGAVMVTTQAALELGAHGIRVNAVSPGLVDTPLTQHMMSNADIRAAFLARIPLGRAAQPSEIARAALFLASDEASYISGTNLVVDAAWLTTGYPDLRSLLA